MSNGNYILAENIEVALGLAIESLSEYERRQYHAGFKSALRAGLEENLKEFQEGTGLQIRYDISWTGKQYTKKPPHLMGRPCPPSTKEHEL